MRRRRKLRRRKLRRTHRRRGGNDPQSVLSVRKSQEATRLLLRDRWDPGWRDRLPIAQIIRPPEPLGPPPPAGSRFSRLRQRMSKLGRGQQSRRNKMTEKKAPRYAKDKREKWKARCRESTGDKRYLTFQYLVPLLPKSSGRLYSLHTGCIEVTQPSGDLMVVKWPKKDKWMKRYTTETTKQVHTIRIQLPSAFAGKLTALSPAYLEGFSWVVIRVPATIARGELFTVDLSEQGGRPRHDRKLGWLVPTVPGLVGSGIQPRTAGGGGASGPHGGGRRRKTKRHKRTRRKRKTRRC